MPRLLTTRQVAQHISEDPTITGAVREWQVRRLFENGTLPEPPKFGNKRVLSQNDVPVILEAMRSRGWLPRDSQTQEQQLTEQR